MEIVQKKTKKNKQKKEKKKINGDSTISSVAQLCPALCDSIDCSTPGFSVHQQLLELAQTHVHQVGDAI